MTEPVEELERRLSLALDRAAAHIRANPPAWQKPDSSTRSRLRSRLPSRSASVLLASAAISVAVVAGAILLLGHVRSVPSSPPKPAVAAKPTAKFAPESALVARVRTLRGTPIVIFVWASWCSPCQRDLPRVVRAAARYRNRVTFLIADANETRNSRRAARAALDTHKLSYPIYETRGRLHGILRRSLRGVPAMIFINRRGKVAHVHLAAYRSLASIEHDINVRLLKTSS